MPRVKTIEQFKIMQFLNAHLELNLMQIELVDRSTVRVTDSIGQSLTFRYQNNSVVWE